MLESQVWPLIREGLRAILVTDEFQQDRVFILCVPASYYYRVMTRADWMLCLVGERF